MKRFLFAIGLLATIAISESNAGYVVIRIVLEGGSGGPEFSGGSGDLTAGKMSAPTAMMPGMGSKGGGPGGPPPGSGRFPMGPGPFGGGSLGGPPPGSSLSGPGLGGMTTGTAATAATMNADPSRSIYVVVPYTNDLTARPTPHVDPKKGPNVFYNPPWEPAVNHQYAHTNLLFDNSQIQLYVELGPQAPRGKRTRFTEVQERRLKWQKNPADAQVLLDVLTDAPEWGYGRQAVEMADELATAVKDKNPKVSPQVEKFLRA